MPDPKIISWSNLDLYLKFLCLGQLLKARAYGWHISFLGHLQSVFQAANQCHGQLGDIVDVRKDQLKLESKTVLFC